MLRNINRYRNSEFLRNIFTLVSGSTIAQAIAIGIYPLLTRFYSPSEHGLFALYMSVISITSIVATGKYELAVMIPPDDRDGAALCILSSRILFLFSIILIIPVFLFNAFFTRLLGNVEIAKWLYFVPISTFLIGISSILSYWSNRKKKYMRIAGANLSQSIINSGVKVSTSGLKVPAGGLILGAIAGQLVGAIYFLSSVLRNEAKHFRRFRNYNFLSLAKKFSFFPRFNMIHYLVNNFSTVLPIFVFSRYFSPEVVGFYSIGFMMVNRPMSLFTSSFTQVFSQRIIEKYNSGTKIHGDVKNMVKRLFFIGIVPFIAVAIFGIPVFAFIFGDNWYDAGKFMQVMLPWFFLVFLSSPLSFLPDVFSRQRKAMWLDILKFILRIFALTLGVILNDIYLAIIFFSGISVVIVSYNLYWYLTLSRNADNSKRPKVKP